ncbi:MAG TPA: hypothetical protein VFQ54_09270, partial [Thermomicrobiales bacterium]|nr:hypothetical protein [Thermomicrobiales bacterium]
PFFDAIKVTMAEFQPDIPVIPTLTAGGTDARLLPDIKIYGFFPKLPGVRGEVYGPLVHGHNERVHVDDITFGAEFIWKLVTDFCTK